MVFHDYNTTNLSIAFAGLARTIDNPETSKVRLDNDWSSAEESRLILMRRRGMSFVDIALAFNRSEQQVACKYLKLVPLPPKAIGNTNTGTTMDRVQSYALPALESECQKETSSNTLRLQKVLSVLQFYCTFCELALDAGLYEIKP